MNDTLTFLKAWETGQEKQERTAILVTPITVVEISRIEKAIVYHERHLKISKDVGDRPREAILATPITVLEISRKLWRSMNDTSKYLKEWESGQEKEEFTVILATPTQ